MGAFARFRSVAIFYQANDGLMHLVGAALGRAAACIEKRKCDVNIRPRGLQALNGQLAADVAFNESGLVAVLLLAPSVHAERSEIARLAFGTVRAEEQILRHEFAGSGGNAVQLAPGDDAHSGGSGVVRQRRWDIEFNKAAEEPSGQDGLIGQMRADEPPVFFFGLWLGFWPVV